MRNDLNASVISSGHAFAATHAASRLVQSKNIDEALDGITQLRFLDRCLKQLDADAIIDTMKALHALIINKPGCMVSVTADNPDRVASHLSFLIDGLSASAPPKAIVPFMKQLNAAYGIEISSSVNFTAKVRLCRKFGPEDLGQLYVLSKNLSTDYLWNKVRVEGGAYGGMAMLSGGHPVFICASYRDPNLMSTLRHFEAGLQSVVSGLSVEEVDQNVIATIGRIDAPATPHEKGFGETVALLCGRTNELRQQVREAVLSATPKALSIKAQQLIDENETAVTVLGSSSALDQAQKEGLEVKREKLL
jgi:presequence protease